MSELKEKKSMPVFSAEQAINLAKWDKRSSWIVLANALTKAKPQNECGAASEQPQEKTEK